MDGSRGAVAVVGVAIIIICTSEKNHREEEEEDDGDAKEEDLTDDDDDDKPMDIIVLTSSTGYDILSEPRNVETTTTKNVETNEEKETFLSSLLPSSKGSNRRL